MFYHRILFISQIRIWTIMERAQLLPLERLQVLIRCANPSIWYSLTHKAMSTLLECGRTTSGRGSSTRISLSDSRWSENTINTYKYTTIYWSLMKSYYNLGSHISYGEEVWNRNYALEDKSEFAEAISLNSQNILFALKENLIHRCSKPEDPSTESNPRRFGLSTDNPRRHRR
jgi:hypothetical protein